MRPIPILLAAALVLAAPLPVATRQAAAASMGEEQRGVAIIMAAGSRAAQVRKLRHVPSVGAVRLGTPYTMFRWRDDSGLPDWRSLRIIASRHAKGIARLRAALAANPVTRRAIERHGIPLDRVVGVRIGSNGALRLYLL